MALRYPERDGPPQLLLLEPDHLIRSTVLAVCKQLGLAEVLQAASVTSAEQTLRNYTVDLMLVSLNQGDDAFTFLDQVRRGRWTGMAEVPIALTAHSVEQAMITRIQPLRVERLLLQPYRIRDLVETVKILSEALTTNTVDSQSSSF